MIKGKELKEQVTRFKEMNAGREPTSQEMEDFLNEYGTGEFEPEMEIPAPPEMVKDYMNEYKEKYGKMPTAE